MRGWIFSLPLAVALATAPVSAQQGQPPAGKQQVRLAKGSPLAKVFFSEPALVLDDDGTYAEAMQRVGKDLSQTCGTTESYAWEFRDTAEAQRQQHASTVFDSTMQSFQKDGYKLVEHKIRSIPDPESVVITAERKDNKLILLWSPLKDATILLVCDANGTAKGKGQPGKK